MLSHYLEISVRPDPEFTEPMLVSALLSKLHRALAELHSETIGISFPEHTLSPRSLGKTLRIHANATALDNLTNTQWLRGMRDHVFCTEIQPIPSTVEYRTVSRRQFKTNVERLRRRRMKRKGESYEEAAAQIPVTVERNPNLPFATLRSLSTGQSFNLFVEHGDLLSEPASGSFSSYGLSNQATIPWF